MQFHKLIRGSLKLLFITLGLAATVSAHAWTLKWDFEEGAPGQKVKGWGANGMSTYSAENGYNSKHSARLTAPVGSTGWGQWGGYITHPSPLKAGDELWFRVRTYYPHGWVPSREERQKFLRIRTLSGPSGGGEGYVDMYLCAMDKSCAFKFIFEGENRWTNVGSRDLYSPKIGTWETYEYYVRFDAIPLARGGKALVRFWKNGQLIAEITDRKTLKHASSIADRTHLFTWWGNSGAPVTQSMWVDDVQLSSSQPVNRDEHGNYFIGMDDAPLVSPPAAPILNVAQ